MKRDLAIGAIAILAVAAITFGLDKARPKNLEPTPSEPYREKTASAAPAPKTGKAIMTVNGEPVTESEFNAFLQGIPEQQRAMVASTPQGRQMLASRIAELKMLEQEAARLGVADDPDVRMRLDLTQGQIIAMHALQKLVEPKVEEIIRAQYEKEKNGAITLRHIAIAYAGGQYPSRDGKPLSVEQAMQKATVLATRIRGGADFAALARAESDDPQSAMNGGTVGITRREMLPQMLPPDVVSAVSKLQPGQITNPVRLPSGIHIFRIDAPTLDDMRPGLAQGARQQAEEETLAALEKRAKVVYDPAFFPQQPAPSPALPPATKSNG